MPTLKMEKQTIIQRTIMWGDLDPLGIVFYPRYYEWMDAGSHLFFDEAGLNLDRLRQERKLIFGLVETGCRYFRPGRYGQKIELRSEIESVADKTVIMNHVVACAATEQLMVEGRESRICMSTRDPEKFKAVTIPEDILSILKQLSRT